MVERREELFAAPIHQIIFVYGEDQSLYQRLSKKCNNIIFTKDYLLLDNLLTPSKNTLLILDDIMQTLDKKCEYFNNLFCVKAHHLNVTILSLIQNPFYHNLRTMSINCSFMILFVFVRNKDSIRTIQRQCFPGDQNFFMESYKNATSVPYGYLVLNLLPYGADKFRLRNSLFLKDKNFKVYVNPKQ